MGGLTFIDVNVLSHSANIYFGDSFKTNSKFALVQINDQPTH